LLDVVTGVGQIPHTLANNQLSIQNPIFVNEMGNDSEQGNAVLTPYISYRGNKSASVHTLHEKQQGNCKARATQQSRSKSRTKNAKLQQQNILNTEKEFINM
jgi:hypothetical protein